MIKPPIITIRLSLPDPNLSPNARINRYKKAALTAAARRTAMLITRAAMDPCGNWPMDRVTARETFVWPTKARRDVRNAEASTKAIWDGIVDSGLIIDDDYWHLTHAPSEFAFNKKDPHLLIDIWIDERISHD